MKGLSVLSGGLLLAAWASLSSATVHWKADSAPQSVAASRADAAGRTTIAAEKVDPLFAVEGTDVGYKPSKPGYRHSWKYRPDAYCIDRDGDGYGVGCQAGDDADDSDPAVATASQALAAHGGLAVLLARRGYKVERIYYISPGGDDRTARPDDAARPYASFEALRRQLRGGEGVIYRAGKYDEPISLENPPLNAPDAKPIVIAAMPGERVVLDTIGNGVRLARSSNIVIDGLVLVNTRTELGEGVSLNSVRNVLLRNMDISKHFRGVLGMQNLRNVVIENCLLHHNVGEHGVYLGCRDEPNSDLAIRGCVIFMNARNGVQHNGRVKNFRVQDNVIHSNTLAGVSMMQGACASAVINNLIFNNNKQGVVFYAYDSSDASVEAYDQCGNIVAGNTIWVGRQSWDGGRTDPRNYTAILLHDDTKRTVKMTDNVFRSNVLVTCAGPAVTFSAKDMARTCAIEGNAIYRQSGPDNVVQVEGTAAAVAALEQWGWRGNEFAALKFPDVDYAYSDKPEKFVFVDLPARPGKPARSSGGGN
jgi:hypothetical protein